MTSSCHEQTHIHVEHMEWTAAGDETSKSIIEMQTFFEKTYVLSNVGQEHCEEQLHMIATCTMILPRSVPAIYGI